VHEPVKPSKLKRILLAALASGEVWFSKHGRQRMMDHDMTEQDCKNVLRAGRWLDCNFEHGSWRYRWRTQNMVVLVAIVDAQSVSVVTAWRLGK
jgi:hypothetical protein